MTFLCFMIGQNYFDYLSLTNISESDRQSCIFCSSWNLLLYASYGNFTTCSVAAAWLVIFVRVVHLNQIMVTLSTVDICSKRVLV